MRQFHAQYIWTAFIDLVPYLWVTLAMMAGTVFFGGLLGLLLARAKIRRGKLSRALAEVYIYLTRCIPSIVMLFVVYYGLPEFLLTFGIDMNHVGKGVFVIITFSVLFSSAMCEVFRSAYLSVEPGQMEAALSIGMSRKQAYIRIILPQAMVAALPNICNTTISLLKSTSLAFMMSVKDITAIAKMKAAYGYNYIEAYLVIAFIYIIVCTIVQILFQLIERRISGYKKLVLS